MIHSHRRGVVVCENDYDKLHVWNELRLGFRNFSGSLPGFFRTGAKRTFRISRHVRRLAAYCLACRKISRLDFEKMSWPLLSSMTVSFPLDRHSRMVRSDTPMYFAASVIVRRIGSPIVSSPLTGGGGDHPVISESFGTLSIHCRRRRKGTPCQACLRSSDASRRPRQCLCRHQTSQIVLAVLVRVRH